MRAILFGIIVIAYLHVSFAIIGPRERLIANLVNNYENDTRPVKDAKTITRVGLSMRLLNLIRTVRNFDFT